MNEQRTSPSNGGRSRGDGAVQRQRLKDAALVLFARTGYHATTIRQITARVSLQPGMLYHYFSSKQDLLREICVDYAVLNQAKAELILQSTPDPIEAVADLLSEGIQAQMQHPDGYQVLRSETRALTKHNRAQVVDALRRHRQNWVTAIERGVAEGTFQVDDVRLAAIMITGLQDIGLWYSSSGRLGQEEVIHQTTKLALQLLGHGCGDGCKHGRFAYLDKRPAEASGQVAREHDKFAKTP